MHAEMRAILAIRATALILVALGCSLSICLVGANMRSFVSSGPGDTDLTLPYMVLLAITSVAVVVGSAVISGDDNYAGWMLAISISAALVAFSAFAVNLGLALIFSDSFTDILVFGAALISTIGPALGAGVSASILIRLSEAPRNKRIFVTATTVVLVGALQIGAVLFARSG
jgi:hypothetical protein